MWAIDLINHARRQTVIWTERESDRKEQANGLSDFRFAWWCHSIASPAAKEQYSSSQKQKDPKKDSKINRLSPKQRRRLLGFNRPTMLTPKPAGTLLPSRAIKYGLLKGWCSQSCRHMMWREPARWVRGDILGRKSPKRDAQQSRHTLLTPHSDLCGPTWEYTGNFNLWKRPHRLHLANKGGKLSQCPEGGIRPLPHRPASRAPCW